MHPTTASNPESCYPARSGQSISTDGSALSPLCRTRQVDVRVQELVARKQAESANLSSILESALIPDVAVQRTALCDEESQAVVKCYQSKGTPCAKFVDLLELCASNASRTP